MPWLWVAASWSCAPAASAADGTLNPHGRQIDDRKRPSGFGSDANEIARRCPIINVIPSFDRFGKRVEDLQRHYFFTVAGRPKGLCGIPKAAFVWARWYAASRSRLQVRQVLFG